MKTNIKPLSFFLLTFCISWAFWVPLALSGLDASSMPGLLLLIAGGLGPALAALVLVLRAGRPALQDFFTRLVDVRRVRLSWWALIWLGYPLLVSLAALLARTFDAGGALFPGLSAFGGAPLSIFPFALVMFLFGPLPEEPGWRGVALDGLQKRMSAPLASLVLGLAWLAWHLPLFLMNGTYQAETVGLFTQSFAIFAISLLAVSVLFTWIYNHTNRSILAAVVFHFVINFTGAVLEPSPAVRIWLTGLLVLSALLVMAVSIRQTASRRLKTSPTMLSSAR